MPHNPWAFILAKPIALGFIAHKDSSWVAYGHDKTKKWGKWVLQFCKAFGEVGSYLQVGFMKIVTST
jgi:hypothetical protein